MDGGGLFGHMRIGNMSCFGMNPFFIHLRKFVHIVSIGGKEFMLILFR